MNSDKNFYSLRKILSEISFAVKAAVLQIYSDVFGIRPSSF